MKNVSFLFPGQGSQVVGMGKDLASDFEEFRSTLDEASETLKINMQELCFQDTEQKLNLTEFTQPAILTISIATLRVLEKSLGLKSALVAGHSLGEYSALVSLGALTFADALKAVHFRGQAMQRAVPVGIGAMAAYLGNSGNEVEALCKEVSNPQGIVEIVNFNSPGQLVLSGHKHAVELICGLVAEKKLGRAKLLPVSAPFHSSLMTKAAEEMQSFFKNITLQAFPGKIIANVDAEVHSSKTYTKEILVRQISNPVLWTQSLLKLVTTETDSLWVEVGPGKVLQGLAKKTIETSNCLGTFDSVVLKQTMEFISQSQ